MVDNPSKQGSQSNNRNRNRAQYDGGEVYENNFSENQGGNKAPSSRAASKPARKAQTKKIQRYESNSIDEEEFQDYFTNPIKRKEFDRQRKKQQMREMQNITGFTLGQFGIKSMKAMKEAMPAYPDDDDVPTTADQQKNYATVSLCCLSVTNPFRNKIIQLVAVNPWFDRFILFVIMVNCIFLALDKEIDSITKNNVTIDFIFLIIYTMEMILKIIAMGFFMRAHSYLRDSWNILDFMVVMLGWVSQLLDSGDISAIKVIRILRPLRTINQIPNMSSLVSTILNSLPIMFDVMVLFFFMLIMFGTIATQLLGGHLEKRCVSNHIPMELRESDEMIINIGTEQQEYICRSDVDCHEADIPGLAHDKKMQLTCEVYGNPISGTYGFDNILLSIMNIFQIITLEGWTDMMYIVRDAERSYMFDLFFVSCVVFGSFVILNLMIAVQASYLDSAFDEEDNRQRELQDKIDLKKKMKLELEEQEEYDEEEEQFEEDVDERSPPGDGRRRSSTRNKKEEKQGCCANTQKPQWFINLSLKCESICESKEFEQIIIVLILINTLFLASEHYDPPVWLVKLSEIANLFFTVVFLIEMLMKLTGFGCKKYLQDNFNIFDAFIVTMSYVELFMPGDASSLSVLRAFRLLRIFKIIKSWESLRILLSTVLDSLTAITNLGVLIVLYLFISALLTKQFYSEPLLDMDGAESRYNFGSTTQALVTVFIVLTGENWNEIMIQVIDQQNSFSPAAFFILLMIIGNFMLLNLFLAILLKSISEIGGGDDEEDPTKADGSAPEGEHGMNDDENDPENDSVPLNSSNSNIEEEFEQIKLQLMALSNNMNAMLDGSINNNADGNDDVLDSNQSISLDSEARQEREERKKQKKVHQQQQAKLSKFSQSQNVANEPKDETQQGYSLFIFSPTNPFRIFLRDFVQNNYFAGFIYHMIALNSLLLALDEPKLSDPYQQKTISNLLLIISIIFVVEMVVKIIVVGFYIGERTYLKDSWNILDFIIVMFSILTWIMEAAAGADISFIRGFRALRALRPLRVVSKNEGIKTVVNSLLLSIPALLNVLLIVLLFLMVFGILGIQLFMGKLGNCNDHELPDGTMVENRSQCHGWFKVDIINADGVVIGWERQKREWVIPINNYDNIFYSMMTFFEISTLEMWPGMMYAAIDSVGIDMVPILDNSQWVSILFIVFIFFTTFFIMNLFISVIVDKFNEEIKKRQGSDNFTDEQKEWVKIQRLLVHTNPKIIPVEPINCFRLQCFKIVQSQAFEYVVMTAIVINTFFLCIDYYGKSDELAQILDRSNLSFVIFFTIEMTLKITAYGFKYYWYVNWNKFDFIIVIMSLVSLNENLLETLNFNPTALRIIRVSRLLRMVKTSEGLRTLLKTLFMSLGNILNTAALLMLIFFTFSVAGMSLFGKVPAGEFIGENVSFTSFYLAMMTLWRASTGESWNGIMHDCFDSQGLISVVFWLMFQLIAFFIFMNVFIAVIGESFNDNQATEDENDILALKKKDIKAFQNTWAKYNPMGELYMRTIRLPDFLRELPPPLGYQGIRIEESKLNKIIFCLNIRDHLGRVYYPEVMWTIFHSIAGMNDDKVLNCEQIINILKLVKSKYKGLGKKVNLDSLCGNKYYRKELTAIKYIQAMKILTKWRNFKVIKAKNKDQLGINGLAADGNDDNRPKAAEKLYQDSANENNRNNQNYAQGNQPELSEALEPYENNSGSYGTEQNQARVKQTRLNNINKAIDRNREDGRSRSGNNRGSSNRGRAQQYVQEDSYGEEGEQPGPRSGNRNNALPEDSFEEMDNESADQDMPVTERNPMSGRQKQQDRRLQRDDMSDPYQSSKQIRGRR